MILWLHYLKFNMKISLDKFESYLESKNLKGRTIQEYIYYFNKFTSSSFNQESVAKFLSEKSNRNGIARSFLINLQKFVALNHKELGLSIDQRLDSSEVELPKLSGRKKRRVLKTLTIDQIKLIEQNLDEEKNKIMLWLSFYGGLRIGELMKIKVISFNWDKWRKDPKSWGECNVLGKGDKERPAFLPGGLMVRVAQYLRTRSALEPNSTIFIRRYDSYRNIKGGSTTWQRTFKKAAIKAGIIKVDSEGKVIEETDISPHIMKHSRGTYCSEVLNMDIKKIKEILGHSSLTSTQIYTHANKENLKKELQNLE